MEPQKGVDSLLLDTLSFSPAHSAFFITQQVVKCPVSWQASDALDSQSQFSEFRETLTMPIGSIRNTESWCHFLLYFLLVLQSTPTAQCSEMNTL